MGQMQSVIFYLTLFSVILFLLSRKDRILHYIAISILIIVSIIRWDVGNDYFSYYLNIQNIRDLLYQDSITKIISDSISEPSLTLICFLFMWLPDVSIVTIAFYATLTILLWYKVLSNINGLFWGFFSIFFLCFFYNACDQIRQALAMALGLYGYRYILLGNFKKYILIAVIAFFIHYSAIILIIMYFTRLYKPNKLIYSIIILIMTYTFFTGLWEKFFERLFLLTTYADYASGGHWTERQEFSSGLGALCWILINSIVCISLVKRDPIITNIIFIGLLIYLFGSGNHLIERVSRYGTIFLVIGIPLYFNGISKRIKYPMFKCILIVLMTTYGIKTTIGGAIGCIPYNTIFSQEYSLTKFKPREGRWE